MTDDANRAALGRYVKQLRMEKYGTVDAARSAASVSRGAWDNVEAGRRVKDFTLAAIAKALGVRAQTFEDMLNGAKLVPGENYRMDVNVHGPTATTSVGGGGDDADTLLFKRPEGLDDETWERLRSEHEDYWQWLLDRASRER